MKILVIDDETLITMSLKRALEKRGHTVDTASNGAQGLSVWRSTDPDLVIVDFQMPDMNADQVLAEIGDSRKCKVVLMSAYLGEKAEDKPASFMVDLFIKKPFENIFEVCDLIENTNG